MQLESSVNSALAKHAPQLAPEIKEYVTSVLCDESNEFEDNDEVYNAVGEIIESSCDQVTEANIKDLCNALAGILCANKSDKVGDSVEFEGINGSRVLPGAVDLAKSDMQPEDRELATMWNYQERTSTTVDSKKLAKAEEKIREKKERRVNKESLPPPNPLSNVTATASQSTNKRDNEESNTMDIRLYSVDVSFGDKQLLSGADLVMAEGKRYGLVGRNGIGKTTFMKMLSHGDLKIPNKIRMLHVEQEVVGDDTTVLDSTLEADERREELLRLEKELSKQVSRGQNDANTAQQLQDIYAELEERESSKAPARAATILHGLGFTPEEQSKPTREFSGGWRMRVALARALFVKPDLLMLDEPTNMLDMKAIYWLENHLQTWSGTILLVSHDRNFLNSVSTDIIHLHSRRFDTYKGNYDLFEKVKEEKLKQQQREYDAQMAFRAHAQEFIDKFRYNAKRASLAQSKIKMLEKLPKLMPVDSEARVSLKFPDCEKLNPPVLQLDDVGFSYPNGGRKIFDNICVGADTESRVCIVGENGAGKTTLLKILLGNLEPTRGSRSQHRGIKIAYFAQHHVDQLDMNLTPLHLAAQRFPGMNAEEYRTAIGRFGLTGDLALQSIQTLSGGQKSRLAFALIAMQEPNFLVLDEPTNHLDVETVEALGKALVVYKGGVVLVSHDERLIELVCKELWVVRRGGVERLEGGLPEYRNLVLKELESY